jgi:glucose/arabinose dehydrogenase
VQPIFREHCVGCHGPTQQLSGLRLDRRADAMRGGSQADIGPGNASGSRLYHRLIGTTFGRQMPPAGPLTDAQVDIIRQWIDEGAVWPDAASGEVALPAPDADAVRLMAAIRDGDRRGVDAQLQQNRDVGLRRGANGTTPLMAAALYADAAVVQRLLAAGADANAPNGAGATALMWAVPHEDKMRALLDAGADVNARSDDRRSPLVIAAGIAGGAPAVKLLLDYGAEPSLWRTGDPSPLREAARADNPEAFRLLLPYFGSKSAAMPSATVLRTACFLCARHAGVAGSGPLAVQPPTSGTESTAPRYDPGRAARPTPIGDTAADAAGIHAAVERSLPLLQEVGIAFINQSGCVSCHHNSLVSMAVAAARANGYTVDQKIATKQMDAIGVYLESWRERAVQNIPIAGAVDTMSYLLLGLAADQYPPDAATDAQAMFLKRRQHADGHWSLASLRPPIESNDVEVTAVSMRALQIFAPPTERAVYADAVDRARGWLTTARADVTEERAFRVLGLRWANASTDAIAAAARDLLALQKDDGGWAQSKTMASDAYASGEALVALRESGAISPADPAYRKGLEFLLRTQIADGSWPVETRAVPIQAYFESGFPYGVNQWVSAAATGWATTALALATQTPVPSSPRPPAPPPGPPRPEDGSAAPDGYAPKPMWPGQTRAPLPEKTAAFAVETAAEGLSGAFGFAFLPDGRIIVSERPGRIRIVSRNGNVSEPLAGLPADLWAHGQGLFEVRPDRAFAANRRLFLTYTVLPEGANQAALPRSPGVLLVASATLSSDERKIENVKVLLNAEGTGGRLIQAPDGTLFITSTIPSGVGINAVDWPQPQQLTSDMGKVLRINVDGTIPKDNPFVGRADARPEIYALGIRDAQGVAIDPRTGLLWISEHGPRGGDEINAIARGKNYGFPVIGYGREYSGKPINGDKTAQDGMEQPIYFWTPDIAPAGITFYTGKLFPEWQDNLFVSALAGKSLVRLVLKGDRVVGEERLLGDLGARIRGVEQGPDGALYVLTDGTVGRILRLVPRK